MIQREKEKEIHTDAAGRCAQALKVETRAALIAASPIPDVCMHVRMYIHYAYIYMYI